MWVSQGVGVGVIAIVDIKGPVTPTFKVGNADAFLPAQNPRSTSQNAACHHSTCNEMHGDILDADPHGE